MDEDLHGWEHEAACRGDDTSAWFSYREEDYAYALGVCELCPVREECLEFALKEGIDYGIYGGLKEDDRRALRRRIRRGAA